MAVPAHNKTVRCEIPICTTLTETSPRLCRLLAQKTQRASAITISSWASYKIWTRNAFAWRLCGFARIVNTDLDYVARAVNTGPSASSTAPAPLDKLNAAAFTFQVDRSRRLSIPRDFPEQP